MTPERWQRIDEVFEAALEREPSRRTDFLDGACAGDLDLRREVESLLRAHEQAGSFIEEPPIEAAGEVLGGDEAGSPVGLKMGYYEVLSPLGSGGMGEVYLALDVRLGRKVALKLLPSIFTGDAARLRRFEQEARAASALNHPNVCVIHEVGEAADGRHYIVMEYVEGATLREHMTGGRMGLAEALDVATQVGSGLAAAHAVGVVHRDVKPENIMLRGDGYAKVLDFGLAKFGVRATSVAAARAGARVETDMGMVMGTSRYMSPEQARGLQVDERTDVWSLGVVLYEMLAGRVPFEGETNSDVIASILEREPPPLGDHAPEAPAELQRIVSKALSKPREERYQTINELLIDLKSLKQRLESGAKLEGAQERKPQSGRRWGHVLEGKTFTTKRLIWLSLLGLTLTICGVWLRLSRRAPHSESKPPSDAPLAAMRRVRLTAGHGHAYVSRFSPDGKQVAYSSDERTGNYDIYVRLLDGGAEKQLTANAGNNGSPVWSPDGQYIAFTRFSGSPPGGERAIFMVPLLGSPGRKLLTARKVWDSKLVQIDWSPTGEFIAYADEEAPERPYAISLLTVATREPRQLTSPPEKVIGDVQPAFSPDGQMLAFVRMVRMNVADLYVMPVAGGEPRRLTFDNQDIQGVTWTPDGRSIVFGSPRGGTMSLWRIAPTGGEPEPLGVGDSAFFPAFSRQGKQMAYDTNSLASSIWRVALPAAHAKPRSATKLFSSTASEGLMQISPDGKRITFTSDRSGTSQIWVCDSDGSHPQQLTTLDHVAGSPSWSPDGRFVAFDVSIEAKTDLYVISADGGQPRRLTDNPADDQMPSWSQDGRWIYFASDRGGDFQLWKIHPEGGDAVQVTTHGGSPAFESRDGRYVYYQKGHDTPGLWRMPVAGDEEELVFDRLPKDAWGGWALAGDGVYFDESAKTGEVVEFYSFATRRVTQIAKLDWLLGLALSPDGQWLLYANRDSEVVNIMLVENFR